MIPALQYVFLCVCLFFIPFIQIKTKTMQDALGEKSKSTELGFIFVVFSHRSNLICAIILKLRMTLEKAEGSSQIRMGTYVFNYLMNTRNSES